MPHTRLTHPTRGTLEFRQTQTDEERREAVGSIAAELGVDRPPLVHIQTRDRTRSLRGRVTGPRRAAADPDTDDWQQALANYVGLLESHVSEFQGTGYTFEDDIRDVSVNAVYHSLEWTLKPGAPYEIEFDCGITIGRGTFGTRGLDRRTPTVDTSMDVAARVDGKDLPGLRQMAVSRSFGINPNPVYNRTSAENNDVVATEGVRHEISFEGTHTGTDAERTAADDALHALIGQQTPVTFETRFPGYNVEGYVMGYNSTLEARFGTGSHHYSLRFIEGTKA